MCPSCPETSPARRRVKAGHILVLAAIFALALALRVAAARHEHIYQWDEAYHALVARNFINHPLLPVLLENCPERYDAAGWGQTRIWLHKPPLPMWAIAASLRIFGPNEFFLRLPSIIADIALLALIAWSGWVLMSPAAGLIAAFMWAVCPSAVGLVGALHPTDFPDVWLCFFSFLFLAILAKENYRRPTMVWLSLGLVLSLAILTKGIAALMLVVLLLGKLACDLISKRQFRINWPAAGCFIAGACAFLPWTLYIGHQFPRLAANERIYAFRHIDQVLEGHGGDWLFHFCMFATNNFGWPLTRGRFVGLIMVGFLVVYGWRSGRPFPRLLSAWALLVFVLFSLARTKMGYFCYPAYPALFLLGAFWISTLLSRDRIGITLVVAAFLMAGIWRQMGREFHCIVSTRDSVSSEYDYRDMRARMIKLNDGVPGIIWNMHGRTYIQASYYSGKTALPIVPTAEDITRAKSAGLANYAVIVENDPSDEQLRRGKLAGDLEWITIARKRKGHR